MLDVSFKQFCQHLNQLGYIDDLPSHVSSVYLCIACSDGSEAACGLLEARYFPALKVGISKFDARADVVDDILQELRCRLLVGPTARIRGYGGRGVFSGWLRAVARTVAVDFVRVRGAQIRRVKCLSLSNVSAELMHAAPAATPEEQVHCQRNSTSIQRALCKSIQALPERERRLLSLYYVGGLTIDQLGASYGLNRSTIARQINRSVQTVRRGLRDDLRPSSGAPLAREVSDWIPASYGWLVMDAAELLGETA
jgi:RNA polymerase sigma-70 factor (ECF subfamily)